ncbi:MAG: Uma2 family endonuclease [Planctomycetes bacterium]|nr:Uma2 family endonuclease [Planctomycetota bacterium]
MSTTLTLTMAEFDRMVERGAFDGLKKRIELIYGELLAMSPAGPVREDVISYLTRWSTTHTSDAEVAVRIQCGIGIPELQSVPEPDVAWVRGGIYRQRRPEPNDVLLLIEVADTSISHDLGTKQNLYAQAEILEYWVVDISKSQVTVMREPTGRKYRNVRVYGLDDQITPEAAPEAILKIADMFAG